MKASGIALGVTLALGISATAGPAAAQIVQATSLQPRLSKSERAALAPLVTAVQARDWAAAAAALPAAQQGANSGYARFLLANQTFALGVGRNDIAMQSGAIEALIASGGVPAAEMPALNRARAALAQRSSDLKRHEAGLTQYLAGAPNDVEALAALSEVKESMKKVPEAISLLDRAIDLRRASGQPVPEGWLRRAVRLTFDNRLAAESLKHSRALLQAYPSPVNWRDSVHIYRTIGGGDAAAALDAMRLTRSANALSGERDYLEFAQALSSSGLASESKAVLDEGVAARMVDPAEGQFKALIASSAKSATAQRAGLAAKQAQAAGAGTGVEALAAADQTFATGAYAKAAELYRAALTKGGIDTALANQRLGMALALAGQRAEAEAALRSVTGPRAELASLWLLWLAQRG
jgi:hypothetical protein